MVYLAHSFNVVGKQQVVLTIVYATNSLWLSMISYSLVPRNSGTGELFIHLFIV